MSNIQNGEDKEGKYDDLYLEGSLGGMKSIKPVEGMQDRPPRIRWGERYKSWAPDRKIAYLEKFADSMNHAADVLQQERNKLLEVLRQKEDQIVSLGDKLARQGQIMQSEIQKANEREQVLNQRIVELSNLNRQQQVEIEHLRGGRKLPEDE